MKFIKLLTIILIFQSCDHDTEPTLPFAEQNKINLLINGKVYKFNVNDKLFQQSGELITIHAGESTTGGSLLLTFYGAEFQDGTSYSRATSDFGTGLRFLKSPISTYGYRFTSHDPNTDYRLDLDEITIEQSLESFSVQKFIGTFRMDGAYFDSNGTLIKNVLIKGSINIVD